MIDDKAEEDCTLSLWRLCCVQMALHAADGCIYSTRLVLAACGALPLPLQRPRAEVVAPLCSARGRE
ncbi:MAG TPA: hypothetical protein VFS67_03640 [Polyangiaceae bacterium]|jgi:hypothetical protein|nr:hypothetical protein [Polyangiaceae bacterium]